MSKDKDNDDIEKTLLERNIYFLNGEITSDSANELIRWLIYHNTDKKIKKELSIYISSDGGSLIDAFGIIDMMYTSPHNVKTIAVSSACSAAFYILISGTKGHRYSCPLTTLMCHEFSNEINAKYHDIKSWVKENESIKDRTYNILENAGVDKTLINKKFLLPSDFYMSPQQAFENKVIDHILGRHK
tara:strand:- start:1767 stop:2327 length:561 start_codon:yes stop_codon:yes gene_type:complete